ncbi:MAG: hypothetical protein WA126_11550 [Thermodesulfovibrionales bacterium]
MAHSKTMKRDLRLRLPCCIGGTGFQPVRRTGKMPVPPRTFQDSYSWAFGPPIKHEKKGGTGFPACAGTAGGGCPTYPQDLSKQLLMGPWPTRKT